MGLAKKLKNALIDVLEGPPLLFFVFLFFTLLLPLPLHLLSSSFYSFFHTPLFPSPHTSRYLEGITSECLVSPSPSYHSQG